MTDEAELTEDDDMADEDKPFVCTETACGMRFTNEDHLSVHLRKHDMSLALSLSTAGGLSPMAIFTDQTPTPTKFLRNCEEIGLFQDLNKNPFEDSFKKAMDEPLDMETPAAEHSIPIPGPDLDTPQPPIPKVVGGQEEDDNQPNNKLKLIKRQGSRGSIVPKKRKKFLTQSMATSTTSEDEDESVIGSSSADMEAPSPAKAAKGNNSPPSVSSSTEELKTKAVTECSQSAQPTPSSTAATTGVTAAAMVTVFLQLPNGLTVPVEVPTSTLTGQQTQQAQLAQKLINPQQIVTLPPIAAPHTQLVNVTKNLPQIVVPNVIQPPPVTVVNRAPDNQEALPAPSNLPPHLRAFKLETSPLAQAAAGTVVSQKVVGQSTVTKTKVTPERKGSIEAGGIVMKTRTVPRTVQGGSHPSTKERLKAALQMQATPSSNQKISQIFQLVNQSPYQEVITVKEEPLSPNDSASTSPVGGGNLVTSTSPTSSSDDSFMAQALNFVGLTGDPDDPDLRRRKFLERNRAAAARCRQKRKKWVNNLESKADELTNINIRLSTEIKALRGEVAELKTLLLAHKDCPVTLQQKVTGHITPQTYVIEQAQDETYVRMMDDSDSDNAKTESTASTNADVIPNILAAGNQPAASGVDAASLVPGILALSQAGLQSTAAAALANGGVVASLPNIITLDQATPQTLAQVGGDLLPSILALDQSKGEATQRHLGVITGPNSMSMIPKIINMDQLLQSQENQKS